MFNMNLPELVENVEKWAADRDLLGKDPIRQALKLYEEAGELASALFRMNPDGDTEHLMDAMDAVGDMTVVLTILARQLGTTLEACLDMAYNEIKDRRGITTVNGFIKEEDL